MTTLGDRTAAELADMLDGMERFPHNTGGLSMLDDEATLEFGWKYPDVGPAQRAFTEARYAHMDSYRTGAGGYSGEAWQRAMKAAHSLAAALRPLGGTVIARCKRQTGWGTCNLALDDDGQCRSTLGHTDQEAQAPSCAGYVPGGRSSLLPVRRRIPFRSAPRALTSPFIPPAGSGRGV